MPSRSDIPVGAKRMHLPTDVDQDPLGGMPQPGYPLDQYTAHTSPPSTVLGKGVRTLVPLIPQATANGQSFCDFAQSRIAADGSRVVPGSVSERLWLRVSLKVALDPASGNLLTNLVTGVLKALQGVSPFDYVFTSPQAVQLEVDVGTTAAPNVIWGTSAVLQVMPQTIGLVVPLFGGAPFLANGARIYATSTTAGLAITDVRTLLRQSRA